MAFSTDPYSAGRAAKTDMQQIEDNFNSLWSSNRGTSSPTGAAEGTLWLDEDSGTLKVRNNDDTAFVAILVGDQNQKFYVYRSNTIDGWLIDTTTGAGNVLALKASSGTYGSVGAYGAWAISGLSDHVHTVGQHVHMWYYYNSGDNTKLFNDTGVTEITTLVDSDAYVIKASQTTATDALAVDAYTSKYIWNADNTSSPSPSITGDGTWRPAALVGTLQYPDFT